MASGLEENPPTGKPVVKTDDPLPHDNLDESTLVIPELNPDDSPGPSHSTTVTRDQCIVHLKLSAVLADLRDSISSHDALFGKHDSQANEFLTDNMRNQARGQIKEKRWAVYTARAVDRFASWWRACIPTTGPALV